MSVQNPITLPPFSEPNPDLALLKRARRPRTVPRTQDVLLVIEVADVTLDYDRGPKLQVYAKAGIVEVWVVDIEGKCVESFRQPSREGYADRRLHSLGRSLSPRLLPGVTILVSDIFE